MDAPYNHPVYAAKPDAVYNSQVYGFSAITEKPIAEHSRALPHCPDIEASLHDAHASNHITGYRAPTIPAPDVNSERAVVDDTKPMFFGAYSEHFDDLTIPKRLEHTLQMVPMLHQSTHTAHDLTAAKYSTPERINPTVGKYELATQQHFFYPQSGPETARGANTRQIGYCNGADGPGVDPRMDVAAPFHHLTDFPDQTSYCSSYSQN